MGLIRELCYGKLSVMEGCLDLEQREPPHPDTGLEWCLMLWAPGLWIWRNLARIPVLRGFSGFICKMELSVRLRW